LKKRFDLIQYTKGIISDATRTPLTMEEDVISGHKLKFFQVKEILPDLKIFIRCPLRQQFPFDSRNQ